MIRRQNEKIIKRKEKTIAVTGTNACHTDYIKKKYYSLIRTV